MYICFRCVCPYNILSPQATNLHDKNTLKKMYQMRLNNRCIYALKTAWKLYFEQRLKGQILTETIGLASNFRICVQGIL